jgi:ankyrin repeat protein
MPAVSQVSKAFFASVAAGDFKAGEALLDEHKGKLDINMIDPDPEDRGLTALGLAIACDKPDYVKMLLRRGADPSKYSDNPSERLLFNAARLGRVECVRVFLEADLSANEKQYAETPLLSGKDLMFHLPMALNPRDRFQLQHLAGATWEL